MLICSGLCEYYETYKGFNRGMTYKTHKQCTRCDHIVSKEDFPDPNCYCCSAKYRARFPKSIETRKDMYQRIKQKRKALEPILTVQVK